MIFAFVISFCSTLNIKAQEIDSKHEVSFGFGYVANSEILDLVTKVMATGMTVGYVTYDNEKFRNPISVEYFIASILLLELEVLPFIPMEREKCYTMANSKAK